MLAFFPLARAQEVSGDEVKKEYYDTGELWEEIFFEGGQRMKSIEYYKSGNLRAIVYYDGMVGREQLFSGGDATRVHHYHPDGKLWKELHFKEGAVAEYLEYGPDGEVISKEPPLPEKISSAHLETSSPGAVEYEIMTLPHRDLDGKYDIFEVKDDSVELILSIPWAGATGDPSPGFKLEVEGQHLRIVYDPEFHITNSWLGRLLFKAKIKDLKPGSYVLDVVCSEITCHYAPNMPYPWEYREKALLLGTNKEGAPRGNSLNFVKIFRRNFMIE